MSKYRKPHRIKKRKSIIKNRFFWKGVLIFIFIIFAVYFLLFSDFFQIDKTIISGNKRVLKEEILNIIERRLNKKRLFFSGRNIFLVNTDLMRKEILESFPQIADARIIKKLPATLSFAVFERTEVARFCEVSILSEVGKCYLLDKNGVIFEEATEENTQIPTLKKSILNKRVRLGQEILDKDLVSKITKIFINLKDLEIPIKDISIVSEDKIVVNTLQGWDIYFDPLKDLNWQLTKLKAVLENSIPIEKRGGLEYIELRFGNFAPFKYKEIE